MKIDLSLFLLMFSVFFALIQPLGAAGLLRVHPTNPRYFTDDTGKAIYLTPMAQWIGTNFNISKGAACLIIIKEDVFNWQMK